MRATDGLFEKIDTVRAPVRDIERSADWYKKQLARLTRSRNCMKLFQNGSMKSGIELTPTYPIGFLLIYRIIMIIRIPLPGLPE